MKIVQKVLAFLPGFEFVTLRVYAGPGQNKQIPVATLRQKGADVLFNLIPGGTFQMGFSEEEGLALQSAAIEAELTGDNAEQVEILINQPGEMRPVHAVTVQPFLLARFPLRLTEACRILGVAPESEEAPSSEIFGDDIDIAIFFEETVDAFLLKSGYQLPSEAQWEYACRAFTETPFWWGDRISDDSGSEWVDDLGDTEKVERCSNGFGLVNMGVYPELCADKWHSSFENAPADGSAWIENPTDLERVARGQAAFSYPWQGVGEWLTMLSAARCFSGISEIGLAIRPVYSLL